MARKAMVQFVNITDAKSVVVHMVICVNLKCAVFVLENKATKAQSLA